MNNRFTYYLLGAFLLLYCNLKAQVSSQDLIFENATYIDEDDEICNEGDIISPNNPINAVQISGSSNVQVKAGGTINLKPGFKVFALTAGGNVYIDSYPPLADGTTSCNEMLSQNNAENNEFVIGMFNGALADRVESSLCINSNFPHYLAPSGKQNQQGYNSSSLNVLKEDGFNVVQSYAPNQGTTVEALKTLIQLVDLNEMEILLNSRVYYRPFVTDGCNYHGQGVNEYDACGYYFSDCESPNRLNLFRNNYDQYIDELYTNPTYSASVWGIQITEEAAYAHGLHYGSEDVACGPAAGFEHPEDHIFNEIPSAKVDEAISHFKSKFNANGFYDKKIVVMEAAHASAIVEGYDDGEPKLWEVEANGCLKVAAEQGDYNFRIPVMNGNEFVSGGQNEPIDEDPKDYVKILNKNDNQAIFFDGSYYQFPVGPEGQYWVKQNYEDMLAGTGPHYLGFTKGIDYSKQYASEVHKVINIDNTWRSIDHWQNYVTNPTIGNANWLWFQTYTSVIHGANGIWFWELPDSWLESELVEDADGKLVKPWKDNDPQNFTPEPDRFERENFPFAYQQFISNLSRELRYLANEGFLTKDNSNVIAKKTDHKDDYCIVPDAKDYIPMFTESVDGYTPENINKEKRTENYGLRYTIRTNGEEVVMIISNPLGVPVTTTLDFSTIQNSIIQNSIGVDVLFNDMTQSISSGVYKIDRNSGIDLANETVTAKTYLSFTNGKNLVLPFAPLDVHVLKFRQSSITPITVNNEGWEKTWSNNGSDYIGGWRLDKDDKFYVGDFDGNGVEELLCTHVDGIYMTMLEYDAITSTWKWKWSNYGNTHAINPYRADLVIGDFDGDGKDEALGAPVDGWTTVFNFENGDWQWAWSDNGTNHHIKPYKENLIAGDFDGDGRDELFGDDVDGWSTMFKFKEIDNEWDWRWIWSDEGEPHITKPYKGNLIAGDFDADGRDELIGFGSTWATWFRFKEINNERDWLWISSTQGANNFSGWGYPLSDDVRVLSGDLDAEDAKDELFFLQRRQNAQWATTFDLNDNLLDWSWNWSANPSYSIPYINDWSLEESDTYYDVNTLSTRFTTDYMLIKTRKYRPKSLLCFRTASGTCDINMVSMYSTSNNANYKTGGQDIGPERTESNTTSGSLNEESKRKLSIYPNPNSGTFTVEGNEITSLKVTNLLGKVVYEQNNTTENLFQIDVSQYNRGVYFVTVVQNGELKAQKVVYQ